jgi:hypothetical protein
MVIFVPGFAVVGVKDATAISYAAPKAVLEVISPFTASRHKSKAWIFREHDFNQ